MLVPGLRLAPDRARDRKGKMLRAAVGKIVVAGVDRGDHDML